MQRICHKANGYHVLLSIFLCLFFVAISSCSGWHSEPDYPSPVHKYIPPQSDLVQLKVAEDTLHFPLDDNAYNSLKSFNLFTENDREFMCFFDERSMAVSIYDLANQQKVKTISIKSALKDRKIYKPTVFINSFDSIFVNNNKAVYLIDSAGAIKNKIPFLENPGFSWAIFNNDTPPILRDGSLFAAVRPYVNDESLSALKEWKVLYEFDFQNKTAKLHYPLPAILREQYYGSRFLDHSYCYNDRDHFVFSFPADSAIYETDLANFHMAYSGKSMFQLGGIPPLSKQEVSEDGSKNFMLRDSYGAIYFDPTKKRYLRVAMSKINEQEYEAKKTKDQRIIIFDDQFRIIGESPIHNSILLKSLIITSTGNIYARVMRKDEYAIHFIRLSYIEKNNELNKIAKHAGNPIP
ncbi:DUF4221 family protein [Niastella caeni]|nr:DUF4221 family protein [Niastella caeni]